MDDSAEGLVDNLSETNWLSMMGGGVGVHVGIRNSDDKSTGVMPHLKMYDASSLAYRQGRTRRGSYAAYLDISHPDIINFLEMRKPTGDQNMRTLNMHHGINIPDAYIRIDSVITSRNPIDAALLTSLGKGSGTKYIAHPVLEVMKDKDKTRLEVKKGDYNFAYDHTSNDNIYKQAYNFLKTLPEFLAATDVND